MKVVATFATVGEACIVTKEGGSQRVGLQRREKHALQPRKVGNGTRANELGGDTTSMSAAAESKTTSMSADAEGE
jgi:hypothetical protein